MISSKRKVAACAVLSFAICTAAHAATLAPLASFGGGDGWLAPGDRSYLTIDNTQRGMAYNPTTGNLLVVNRSGGLSIHILDGDTGDDLGTLDQGSGIITGGFFLGNMIGVGDDGAIYMGNLSLDTTSSIFKIYRWENESATPTVAYSSAVDEPLAGARIGDTLDIIGSGTGTRLVAGYGSAPAVAGNNSFALFDTTDGLNFTATHVDVATSPPIAGDFRLGITFRDDDTVLGRQTAHRLARIVDVTGSMGTLTAEYATEGAGLNPMDFATVQDKPLLALANINDSRLFVYDITEPFEMVDPNPNIAVATTTTLHTSNPNGTGQVKFGAISGDTAVLYALNTNNGIQAFELTLDAVPPENNGDYNGNGVVDAADYVIWRATEGQSVDPGTGADGSGDGVVGPEDYDHWVARFGDVISGGGAGNVAAPEPSTFALLTLALAWCLAATRRRGV